MFAAIRKWLSSRRRAAVPVEPDRSTGDDVRETHQVLDEETGAGDQPRLNTKSL